MSVTVNYIYRCPSPNSFSIERVFDAVIEALPASVRALVCYCPNRSASPVNVIKNAIAVWLSRRDINHITGDVHYVAMLLPKQTTVLTIHDCVSVARMAGLKKMAFTVFWYWIPARRVAAITVISQFTKQEVILHAKCNPDLIEVVYDPLPKHFTYSGRLFNSECPVILQVGTGEHNKNLIRVAQALTGLRCTLNIIGRLSERQKTCLATNKISYTNSWGLSDGDIAKAYRDCDLVVFASTYEGFGMPIIEAQATGRPVVTSNLCSMPEIAGDGACFVDPFDVESIRQGVLKVIYDSEFRTGIVSKGRENARRFSPEAVAQRYCTIYDRVLEKNRSLRSK